MLVKDPETHKVEGPFKLLDWGRGYAVVSTPAGQKWVLAKFVKLHLTSLNSNDPKATTWKRCPHRMSSEEELAALFLLFPFPECFPFSPTP